MEPVERRAAVGKLSSFVVRGDVVADIVWDDGAQLVLDFSTLFARQPVLALIANPSAFALGKVSADGWSVEWPAGIDFSALQLRRWAEVGFADVGAAA
jgi:hypothetical protein